MTARARFGLVTIAGVDYQIVDIGLRMLEPKELYGCQGVPDDYIIDHDYTGKEYLPELCVAERTPNCMVGEEQSGQLKFT